MKFQNLILNIKTVKEEINKINSMSKIQSELIFSKRKSAIFVQGIAKNVREYEIQELLNEINIFCLKIPKDSNRNNYGYAIISFNLLKEGKLIFK